MSPMNWCVAIVLFVSVVRVNFAQNVANDVDAAKYAHDARSKSDEILSNIMQDCVNGQVESVSTCLKLKVLHYFDYDVSRIASPRSLSDNDVEKIDQLVVKRVKKYLKSRQFEIQLPEFFFQKATLVFSPEKSLTDFDVVFPKPSESEDRSMSAARDMMQQKALLPLLMMLKMKMKMITPIMLTLVSIKATKALVFSKIALLMVTLFMASQLLKKLGMALPMLHHPPMEMPPMGMASMTTPPPYGAPAPLPPSSSYGAPSNPSSSYGSPSSSYAEPSAASWEPSSASSNTYSKVWDPQQIAYSAYYKSGPSSSSSSLSSSSSSSSTSTI